MCVAHPTLSELLPILMQSRVLAEPLSRAHSRALKGGAGFSRPVSLSLRSREARFNTSYSNTKRGCDVHTNEPIIGGFVTQFLLSLIWQTNSLCAHVCASFLRQVRARFTHPRLHLLLKLCAPHISHFHILQPCLCFEESGKQKFNQAPPPSSSNRPAAPPKPESWEKQNIVHSRCAWPAGDGV